MAIKYYIDPDRRIVFANGHGSLTDQDLFGYQRDVWSRPEVAGYDELMDMSDVTQIVQPSSDRIRDLEILSAEMDARDTRSKFAIVAPENLAFGLGRMYAAYRDLNAQSTKQVVVFRSRQAALEWLETREPPRPAACADSQ